MTRSGAPLLLVIGVLALVGAAGLAWYGSLASLDFDKPGGPGANAALSLKLFGLVPIGRESVNNVVSVKLVDSRELGSKSRTPPRLVFVTDASAERDLGHDQQRFAPDFPAIRDYLADASVSRLSLSSARNDRETVRFVAAQAGVLVLAVIGIGSLASGVGRLRAPPA